MPLSIIDEIDKMEGNEKGEGGEEEEKRRYPTDIEW